MPKQIEQDLFTANFFGLLDETAVVHPKEK